MTKELTVWGSVDREVTSNSRGPVFECEHWQFYAQLLTVYLDKTRRKKRPGKAHFDKKTVLGL